MPDLCSEITDNMPQDVQDLCRRAANVYYRCRHYSGRLIHDVNGFAGILLNGVHNLAVAWKCDLAGRSLEDAEAIKRLRCKDSLEKWLNEGLAKLGKELP